MPTKKILVVGASGMVGSRFVELASANFQITSVDENQVDITKKEDVKRYFEGRRFDGVVNFSAYTNVDGAEKERGDQFGFVWKLNADGPSNLASVCLDNQTFLVQISTDFIFPGTENYPGPYTEDSKLPQDADGISWYGWTKRIAEEKVLKTSKHSAVVRFGYPFRGEGYPQKLDWARNLIKLYNEQKLYPLFTDQIHNILFIDDLVLPLSKIINDKKEGVFHIVSSNTTTPYDSAVYLLKEYAGKDAKLEKGSIAEFIRSPSRTIRPKLGGLKSEFTQANLDMHFDTWQKMISKFVKQYVKINE